MSISPENIRRMTAAAVGSAPKSDIAALAAKEFAKGKPGIVQPAVPVKNHAYWLARGLEIKDRYKREWGQFLKEYKESGGWREVHLTWEDACEELGIPKRTADHQIAATKTDQSKVLNLGNSCPSENNLSNGACASTGQSPTSSQDEKPTPKSQGPDSEEPPPTPRIRTENGKAKRDLAVWGEIRDYIGHAVNRLDTLNQHCPNPAMKKNVRADLDNARSNLDTWWNQTK